MKNTLILSSLFFAFAAQAEETFVPKKFTWTYSVQAKDATDCNDIAEFHNQMRSMIDDIHVNRCVSANMYEKLLSFIKEVQEAIVAGFNLFSASHTAVTEVEELANVLVESVAETVEQAADQVLTRDVTLDESEIVEQATEEVDQAQDAVVANIKPVVLISISCSVLEPSELELWNNATVMLQDLSDKINAQVLSPLEIIDAINQVALILQQLQSADMFFTAA